MFVRDEPPAKYALDGIVHPGARLEGAECPEPDMLPLVRDAHEERERGGCADRRAELRVQGDRALVREHKPLGWTRRVPVRVTDERRLMIARTISGVMLWGVQGFGLRR